MANSGTLIEKNVNINITEICFPTCNSEKRRGRLSEGDLLLHDNARPQGHSNFSESELRGVETSRVYNTDLGLSHYKLFGQLKDVLRGRRFVIPQQV